MRYSVAVVVDVLVLYTFVHPGGDVRPSARKLLIAATSPPP